VGGGAATRLWLPHNPSPPSLLLHPPHPPPRSARLRAAVAHFAAADLPCPPHHNLADHCVRPLALLPDSEPAAAHHNARARALVRRWSSRGGPAGAGRPRALAAAGGAAGGRRWRPAPGALGPPVHCATGAQLLSSKRACPQRPLWGTGEGGGRGGRGVSCPSRCTQQGMPQTAWPPLVLTYPDPFPPSSPLQHACLASIQNRRPHFALQEAPPPPPFTRHVSPSSPPPPPPRPPACAPRPHPRQCAWRRRSSFRSWRARYSGSWPGADERDEQEWGHFWILINQTLASIVGVLQNLPGGARRV
jgi:hypothetical protein